jgi:hypothetical protein
MKKTITAITLAMLLSLGTTFANAEGILVADRSAATCTSTDSVKDGIIYLGRSILEFTGILVADLSTPCSDGSKDDGILVAD